MQFTSTQRREARQLAAAIAEEPDADCDVCGGEAHYVPDFDGEQSYATIICDAACRPCWACGSTPTVDGEDGPECARCTARFGASS